LGKVFHTVYDVDLGRARRWLLEQNEWRVSWPEHPVFKTGGLLFRGYYFGANFLWIVIPAGKQFDQFKGW
jgi:hypothetical protein